MALFGSNRKKFGLFGQPEDAQTPGYGQDQQAPPPQQNGGGGFFGQNGVGTNILGSIGDFLLQRDGAGPIYAPMKARQDEMRMAEQMYQRRRQDTLDDWKTQQQWERDNPKPVNNDTVADYNFIRQTLGDQSARDYLTNKTLPPPFVQHNSDGTSTLYPQGLPRGNSGPQPGMIRNGYQFKGGNPNDQNNWVEMPSQAAPSGGQGGPDMGYNGQGAPSISQQEAATVLQSMGGDQNRFQQWMRQHRVTIRP